MFGPLQKMQWKKFKEEEEQEDTATFIILMKRMCRIFVLKNSWCTFLWASNICNVWYMHVNSFIHLLRCNYLPTTIIVLIISSLMIHWNFINIVDINFLELFHLKNMIFNKLKNTEYPNIKGKQLFILKRGSIHLGTPCHHSH